MADNEAMKEEFAYFGEIWNFFKKFYWVREDEAFWDAVVQRAGEIIRRHDSILCKEVTLAVVDELERRRRAGKGTPQSEA